MKENDIFRISDLMAGFLAGTLTPEEEGELEEWCRERPENRAEFDAVCDRERLRMKMEAFGNGESGQAFEAFAAFRRKAAVRRRLRYACCASVILLCCICSAYLYLSRGAEGSGPTLVETVAPEAGRPVLTLASGEKKVILSDSLDVEEAYAVTAGNGVATQSETRMNRIEVPVMCDFIFTLSDGTKVWMNASSSLEYPEKFAAGSRTVRASGEIYLEVARDENRPFIVETDRLQVKVLGTSFSVRSYPDEETSRVALAEGSVGVSVELGDYVLVPGQQLSYRKTEREVRVEPVDLDEVNGWMRGVFVFRNSWLEEVSSAVRHWYDVELVLEGENSRKLRYTGVINKEEPLEVFLRRLEEVSDVRCIRKGNKVLIR